MSTLGRSIQGHCFRRRAIVPIAALVIMSLVGQCRVARGQEAEPIQRVLQEQGHLTPAQREALFERLDESATLLDAQARVIRGVTHLIAPSVVHLEANVTRDSTTRAGYVQRIEEAGAGVIVELGGGSYVLTNRHVIHGAALKDVDIEIADGRLVHPTKVWSDPETDIAVLALDEPDLVPARTGDSDKVDIGDFVLAVGSPFGLSRSITSGIVSAKGRRNLELGSSDVHLQDFIQTDAAINPGNSGGPLVDARGRVIGIITAIASSSGGSEGVGFAIPIDMFMKIARQLIEHGEVGRAFLGVTLDSNYDLGRAKRSGLPYPLGTRVTRVVERSPAEAAGVQVGDIILKINGVAIDDDDHLVNYVNCSEVGETLTLLIYRDKRTLELDVQVAARNGF